MRALHLRWGNGNLEKTTIKDDLECSPLGEPNLKLVGRAPCPSSLLHLFKNLQYNILIDKLPTTAYYLFQLVTFFQVA
jgi:hypothetical protein